MLELWKAELKLVNEKAAEALADPAKYPNLFPDLDIGLMVMWTLFIVRFLYLTLTLVCRWRRCSKRIDP